MHGFEHFGVPRDIVLEIRNSAALAIYTYLAAKGPTWQPRPSEIQNHFLDMGRPTYNKGWRVLKEMNLGWITTVRQNGRIYSSVMNFCMVPLSADIQTQINEMNQQLITAGQVPDLRYRADIENLLQATKSNDLFTSQDTVGQNPDLRCESDPITADQDADPRSIDQDTDSRDEASENAGSTVSQDTVSQNPVCPSSNIYINNKAFTNAEPGKVYSITRDWKPDDVLATRLFPDLPIQFIVDMTASFVSYRLADPECHTKRRTHSAWMDVFAKHIEVNWPKHRERYGAPTWGKRGFKSEAEMHEAQERQAHQRMAEQFAAVLKKCKAQGEPVPEIPPHLAELIDPITCEVVAA